ncbi:unnamed protein product, partial [Allacma fusca]
HSTIFNGTLNFHFRTKFSFLIHQCFWWTSDSI